MDRDHNHTYPPLNTLKPVADDVWLVDGPVIRFGLPLLKMPFPTRMTIIRIGGGDLFVHSPTPLTPKLSTAIAQIGRVRWIVAPNRLHYWWTPEWKATFSGADVYLAPRVEEQAGDRIDFPFLRLEQNDGYPWDSDIATIAVTGSYMTEMDFFHRPSRTLVLADLIENFEPAKIPLLTRWLARIGGCLDPHGGTPRDLRMTFSKRKAEFRAVVETMTAWQPERIILAHGRWYERNGTEELQRAFDWLLH
ncbi:MAG: DUF4336 domain-containing protein [Hyphomicrobium sp.]|uniref:DUF4336 domain-containing protein n=1 Tax=Hyphomicrobium sp. TaxID=82 RepID=UPI0039E41B86